MERRLRLLVGAAAVLGALAACAPGPEPETPDTTTAPPSSSGPAETRVVAEGLDAPWAIAFHGETPLISERDTARILELGADGETRTVGTIAGVAPRGEGGLLGIAVRDGLLYAYSTADGENRIERYELTGGPGSLGLGPPEPLLGGIPAARIHNGGRIAFGPDGMLYATTGDAGNGAHAQDPDSLGGKILRLRADGSVPDDNPFAGSPVYSYGHRNPQGLAWDDDGTLYASEFGQNTWDELNVIEAGANYGWPEVEGIAGREGFVDPVQQWRPADASPSGMAFTGGSLFIANLRGERLREVPLEDAETSTEHFAGEHGRLRDTVLGPDGELWLLTNNTDGRGAPSSGDDRVIAVDTDQPASPSD
ncbi:PQQ-dependent sugar dehydrogenase [Zhihengliuella halotolerans]|uniref:Glucose/arabinose dehydrogenase n=1 Tax=Zhihengliuella halotolerans TaxID=370736 RepID=A0A4Q8AHJ8_9MICC|nr:PQQ-dependent sugar dehydrogenase [Zhihengliuella halotolerans]RZU63361.1 glucose/arabinose dehydrogenase [Zhihengliuella halotolerans]